MNAPSFLQVLAREDFSLSSFLFFLPSTMNTTPRFLITIDTEGDNLWSLPREITTSNAKFLPRFQNLS